jgi:hypothetical protein
MLLIVLRDMVVVCTVFKPNMFQTAEERQAVREEVRIMSKIFHPNVVLFMGACTLEGNNIMIGMLQLLLCDLLLYIKSRPTERASETDVRYMQSRKKCPPISKR